MYTHTSIMRELLKQRIATSKEAWPFCERKRLSRPHLEARAQALNRGLLDRRVGRELSA